MGRTHAHGIDAAWERYWGYGKESLPYPYCNLLQQEDQAWEAEFPEAEEPFWEAWDLKLDVPGRLFRDFHGTPLTDPELLLD